MWFSFEDSDLNQLTGKKNDLNIFFLFILSFCYPASFVKAGSLRALCILVFRLLEG